MTWIRNPWWDGFWILSGPPIGLALILMPPIARLVFFTLAVLLETGHSLSPIVLAWTHRGFRQIMLRRPRQYVVLPGVIFAAAVVVGAITSLGWTSFVPGPRQSFHLTDWTNPLPIMVWIYFVWNIYHFGMQNFGVLSLYKRNVPRSCWQRRADIMVCLGATAFGMAVLPLIWHEPWLFFLGTGVFSFNHWLVAIGLSSGVSRYGWLFAAGVLLAGAIGFVWMIPTSNGMMISVIPIIICARMGLGFVHFLYDRWLWKFSDPRVRETIGRDLFRAQAA